MTVLSDPSSPVAIAARMLSSVEMCCKTVLSERFSRPFSSVLHPVLFRLLESVSQKKVCIAPRGLGKSTLLTMAKPLREILLGRKKFIVVISSGLDQAMSLTEDLKRELEGNEVIAQYWGDLRGDNWSKQEWETRLGTKVMPRGAGQQVRGIKHGRHRPDLIILDDLEDPKNVQNEEIRKETWRWLWGDVLPAVDMSRDDWEIFAIGTLLHQDSVLARLLDQPEWEKAVLSLCDVGLRTNWPEFMSQSKVDRIISDARSARTFDVFCMEYLSQMVAGEDATFRKDWFKYYTESESELTKSGDIESVVIIDPAKTSTAKSDYSAVVGWGVDRKRHRFYLRDLVMERFQQKEMYRSAFDMCSRLGARVLGVEETGLNDFISHPIKTQIAAEGLAIEYVGLKAKGKKEDRIASLVPYYQRGEVFHRREISGPLEAQLLSFPRAKHDDASDAAAYLSQMLEIGQRYFWQSEPEDAKEIEREYDSLREEDEEALEAEWMMV